MNKTGIKIEPWVSANRPSNNWVPVRLLLGSLSNGDGNENGKKAIGQISKTKTLQVHHAFLYISFPSLHDYN